MRRPILCRVSASRHLCGEQVSMLITAEAQRRRRDPEYAFERAICTHHSGGNLIAISRML